MRKLPISMFLLIFLFPAISHALDATINKVLDGNGFLQAVLITTKEAVIRVNVYGFIEGVAPNDPKTTQLDALQKALGKPQTPYAHPLTLTYYPRSSMDGNGGKLASIDDLRIVYYPCTAANQTFNSIQYSGQNVMPPPTGTPAPFTINPRYLNTCTNVSSSGGKVQSIGDLNFAYYPDTTGAFNNTNAGSSGKLQRVGDITITYYPQNSFVGQAGQVQP